MIKTYEDPHDGSEWRLKPHDALQDDEFHELIKGLPDNWQTLDWHVLENVPCLAGDDVYVAIDKELETAYGVFDAWTTAVWWPSNDLDSWARKVVDWNEESDLC